jgi:hypothetical protein
MIDRFKFEISRARGSYFNLRVHGGEVLVKPWLAKSLICNPRATLVQSLVHDAV